MNNESGEFDIVVPAGMNDYNILTKCIEYAKQNIIGHRNIYIVSPDDHKIDGTIFINENTFCVNMSTVERYHGKSSRNGWYLQQLLKLYASQCIPGLLSNYLVIDADTCFLKPTRFFDGSNKPFLTIGYEYHPEYFYHMQRLHPSLSRTINPSGICHHCMFNKGYVFDIMILVQDHHNKPFYQAFLECVSDNYRTGSGASEYEIYFHYLTRFHMNNISVRELKWENVSVLPENDTYHDYVACHHYLRPTA